MIENDAVDFLSTHNKKLCDKLVKFNEELEILFRRLPISGQFEIAIAEYPANLMFSVKADFYPNWHCRTTIRGIDVDQLPADILAQHIMREAWMSALTL